MYDAPVDVDGQLAAPGMVVTKPRRLLKPVGRSPVNVQRTIWVTRRLISRAMNLAAAQSWQRTSLTYMAAVPVA